jgi:hypothetical protein
MASGMHAPASDASHCLALSALPQIVEMLKFAAGLRFACVGRAFYSRQLGREPDITYEVCALFCGRLLLLMAPHQQSGNRLSSCRI